MKPRLLDLFCGAGGCSVGYARAGFEVVGCDLNPQPRYPFAWGQGDALGMLDDLLADHDRGLPLDYDAIHASPPCQDYSVTASLHDAEYPRLIGPVRERLVRLGLPYVIENVEGARSELRSPIRLCGSSFGLGVRRHRLFELSFPVLFVPPCAHYLQPEPIDVTGTGGPRLEPRSGTRHPGGGDSRKPRNLDHAREVMGIDWMSRRELSEAIPPAYTEWIGTQLIAALEVAA